MPPPPQSKPSFSLARRLGIGLQVLVLIAVVFSVLVMVNYISRDYFQRFEVSTRNRIELSPLTLNLLKSLTNQVRITLYYDKKDPLCDTVWKLARQYEEQSNQHVVLRMVDYLLDAGSAQKVREEYELGATTNLIIFDCNGSKKTIPGNTLADYDYEAIPGGGLRQKFIAFRGETAFTAALLAVTEAKALQAYVLQGHGEHDIDSGDDQEGYVKFASILKVFHIEVHRLDNLAALAGVPTNCDLLIIPGPQVPIPPGELDKIEQYLARNGSRLLVLLDASGINRASGLQRLLAKWGVGVGNRVVADEEHFSKDEGVLVVSAFSVHPLVSPIYEKGQGICLVRPLPVWPLRAQSADAPQVQPIAFTGPRGHLEGDPLQKSKIPLMVSVEKSVPGVATDRGPSRLVVVGDSLCLANNCLDLLYNYTFAECAVNWLVDRSQLLHIPRRPVVEYTLFMTKSQLQSAELILLAGLPGGVLLVGMLVWLRRRR